MGEDGAVFMDVGRLPWSEPARDTGNLRPASIWSILIGRVYDGKGPKEAMELEVKSRRRWLLRPLAVVELPFVNNGNGNGEYAGGRLRGQVSDEAGGWAKEVGA